ncbi:phage tail sheath subtilisin-like domain-containing protein [Otariodibacter oris]|uniref:Phage tail sheath gpL-like n=1 Tax=Otariodibacter oris TaxID=1032623 RepID=A0A420XJ68_9PAST|nr:phage tail sheath subtilisin-like domain-containing protein [Otariodibacter oris]QGM80662.1 phage tail protein [Otariodibacter oris]RKR77178.1 phage tail sheath gpL-like [Otariodibacter oris]
MTNIVFDSIPTSIRKPGVYSEYNSKQAVNSLPVNPQEVLIVAPQTKEIETEFSSPIKIFSDTQAEEEFGAGSWAHLMVRQALRNNPNIRLTVVGLKDNRAGVAATGKVAFNGTASNAGVMSLKISGVPYSLAIAKGESDTALANRLMAVINGARDCPVLATIDADSSNKGLKLTAKSKGEIGNEIELDAPSAVADVAISLTALAGGQQNASLAGALASVAGEHFNIIVSPFVDETNASALREHLESVSSPTAKKPAIGVMSWRGTMATGITFTSRLNSERITVAWYKGAIESNAILAAGYAAIIASEEDPARPLNTLEVKGLSVVDSSQYPTFSEFNQALYNGLTPLEVVNFKVRIMRAITTYTKSATNTDDPSWLDLTTIRSMDYVRKAIEQRIELRFPRSKLHNKIAKQVRSEILDVLYRLEDLEVVERVDEHKSKLIVSRNGQDANRLDTAIPADVVNGLHVVANRIDLIL